MTNWSHRSEDDLKELYINRDLTQSEIAEKTGVTTSTVSKWLNKLDIETGYDGGYKDIIEANYDPDKTFEEMVSGTDLSKSQFRYRAKTLGVHDPDNDTYTDQELISVLEDIAEENGSVSKNDIREKDDFPSVSTFQSRFGSWLDALKEAGVATEHQIKSGSQYTREGILDSFESFVDAYSVDSITLDNFLGSEYGPTGEIQPHFDSFHELLEESSVEEEEYPTQHVSDEFLLDKLSGLSEPVQDRDIKEELKFSPTLYSSRFGSIKDACDLARIECSIESNRKGYTDEYIKEQIEGVASDGVVGWGDLEEMDIAKQTINNRAGERKISDAVEHFGYEYDAGRSTQYSDEELLEAMEKCYEKYGEVKIGLLKRDEDLPSFFTYVYRFGSWSNAKEEAGFEPHKQGRDMEHDDYTHVYTTQFLKARDVAISRDNHTCQMCDTHDDDLSESLHAHHINAVRPFGDPDNANVPENLVMVCSDCHDDVEAGRVECPKPDSYNEDNW